MSKSVVFRLTMKSSRAFRPPSLYAPPVTAPPARTNATRGLRFRAARSLFWTIVSPMVPPCPPLTPTRTRHRRRAASSPPDYSRRRPTTKPNLRRGRRRQSQDATHLRRRSDRVPAQPLAGGHDGGRPVDVDPSCIALEPVDRNPERDQRQQRVPR